MVNDPIVSLTSSSATARYVSRLDIWRQG